jgi:hypothetical protein
MSQNGSGFRPDEIVKIQNRDFVVIGGRLRVVHESHPKLSITTEVLDYVLDQHAVVRARVLTQAGEFTGTGVATAARDPKLADALIELAETRAVARALRFGGVGVETCGFEEIGAGPVLEATAPRQNHLSSGPVGVPPDRVNGNGGRGTPATGAQRRAIAALARQIGREVDEVVAKVYPGITVDGLTLAQASALIDRLRTKAGNGAGAGR